MKKLLFLLLFSPFVLMGQARFTAGVVAGLTASQIDGDLSAGYNKLGFQGGLRVNARLKTRSDLTLEFLFTQRGCQNELIPQDLDPNPFALTLNYVEVPVLFNFKDWFIEGEDEKSSYHKAAFSFGFSYARLINSKVDDDFNWLNGVAPDLLKKNDLGIVLGINFFATRHFGFSVRWNRSLLLLYDSRTSPVGGKSWNSHHLNFQTVYLF